MTRGRESEVTRVGVLEKNGDCLVFGRDAVFCVSEVLEIEPFFSFSSPGK